MACTATILMSSSITAFSSSPALPVEPAVSESRIDKKAAVHVITENICFNEGVAISRNAVLLSNFGGEELNPLNKAGKGYILSLDKSGSHIIIPADGNLNAPKGMATKGEHLFVADVSAIWIYNIKRPSEMTPIKIALSDEDAFVNDIIIVGDMLLASVTNTGRLYTVDVRDPELLRGAIPIMVANIPGANGLVEREGKLYIASYNPSGTSDSENVIYGIDISQPDAKLTSVVGNRHGQYDGLALNEDGTKLYFSNWCNIDGRAEVGFVDLANGNAVTTLDLGVELQGPADIAIDDKYLYIPDLPANKLYIMEL